MKLRFIILFFVIIISGCKKYPEGGKLGGLTGTEQKIAGDYKIISYYVNGYDSTSAINSNSSFCADVHLKFERNQGGVNTIIPSCGTCATNSWRATDDRKFIEITCSEITGASSLSVIIRNKNVKLTWQIQKLTNESFWISTSENLDDYYLKLERL